MGMLEVVEEVFQEAKYQRCTVHFYCNVFSVKPRYNVKLMAKMFSVRRGEDGIEEMLTYCVSRQNIGLEAAYEKQGIIVAFPIDSINWRNYIYENCKNKKRKTQHVDGYDK